MNILYLGPDSGTCRQRRRALERLGHNIVLVDPFRALPHGRFVRSWCFRTGAFGLGGMVEKFVMRTIDHQRFDLIWVDMGELVGPSLLVRLKTLAPAIVNFNLDNPFVSRDRGRWRLFHRAVGLYDLFVSLRHSTVRAASAAGVRRTLKITQVADEFATRAVYVGELDQARFEADVVFAGTWMPERGPFMSRLIERGVPLRIYGGRWNLAPEYQQLRPFVVLGELVGDDYSKALQGAKIALGLLSEGNEDLHTTRSIEIPAMGVLLAAKRTSDHLEMYEEGSEAVFWADADECADRCLQLLADPSKIREIAAAGRRRVQKNGAFNEQLLAQVLEIALG